MTGQILSQDWIFDMAEQDPERLLSLSEEEFRSAMADAGFDVEDLVEQFHAAIAESFQIVQRKD